MKIRKTLTTAFAVFAMLAFAGVASAAHHEKAEANPCGGEMANPCNPCGGHDHEMANPCGGDADKMANPCNPCGGHADHDDGDEMANPCGGGEGDM